MSTDLEMLVWTPTVLKADVALAYVARENENFLSRSIFSSSTPSHWSSLMMAICNHSILANSAMDMLGCMGTAMAARSTAPPPHHHHHRNGRDSVPRGLSVDGD